MGLQTPSVGVHDPSPLHVDEIADSAVQPELQVAIQVDPAMAPAHVPSAAVAQVALVTGAGAPMHLPADTCYKTLIVNRHSWQYRFAL